MCHACENYDWRVPSRLAGEDTEEQRLRRQAGEATRLDAEAEAELLRRREDPAAVESLVRHNLDLVVRQADAHLGGGLGFTDLYQEGTLGLLEAVRMYAGGGDFRDFASLHVGLQMDTLLESESSARREDEAVVADVRALDLAQVELQRRLGREANETELADALRWEPERLQRAARNLDLARERNDELTLRYLDEEYLRGIDELGLDEEQPDPRRKLPGHGPDE